jgi:LmbE family N-acetylglucosaminyl deacetylase
METLLHLAQRRRIGVPVALVAAHPDDETTGAGASLRLFADLLMVHITDGAPRNLRDATAAGYGSASAYAAARRRELLAAMAAGQATPRFAELRVADQGTSERMREIASRLADLFARNGTRVVITHAYEGGHPDHDATAFAVHAAARRCTSLRILEMTTYHAGSDGRLVSGAFLPNGAPELRVPLDAAEQATKHAMVQCFVSQRATLAPFGVEAEAFRPAPTYDFAQPPHAGALYYEQFDRGMTGPRWRRLAVEAMAAA